MSQMSEPEQARIRPSGKHDAHDRRMVFEHRSQQPFATHVRQVELGHQHVDRALAQSVDRSGSTRGTHHIPLRVQSAQVLRKRLCSCLVRVHEQYVRRARQIDR